MPPPPSSRSHLTMYRSYKDIVWRGGKVPSCHLMSTCIVIHLHNHNYRISFTSLSLTLSQDSILECSSELWKLEHLSFLDTWVKRTSHSCHRSRGSMQSLPNKKEGVFKHAQSQLGSRLLLCVQKKLSNVRSFTTYDQKWENMSVFSS